MTGPSPSILTPGSSNSDASISSPLRIVTRRVAAAACKGRPALVHRVGFVVFPGPGLSFLSVQAVRHLKAVAECTTRSIAPRPESE